MVTLLPYKWAVDVVLTTAPRSISVLDHFEDNHSGVDNMIKERAFFSPLGLCRLPDPSCAAFRRIFVKHHAETSAACSGLCLEVSDGKLGTIPHRVQPLMYYVRKYSRVAAPTAASAR